MVRRAFTHLGLHDCAGGRLVGFRRISARNSQPRMRTALPWSGRLRLGQRS